MKKVSIHREGYTILLVTGLGLLLINAIAIYLLQVSDKTAMAISLLSAIIFFFVLYFFPYSTHRNGIHQRQTNNCTCRW
jgi:uncharacterized membrane protein